jgi:hypothetical protein
MDSTLLRCDIGYGRALVWETGEEQTENRVPRNVSYQASLLVGGRLLGARTV